MVDRSFRDTEFDDLVFLSFGSTFFFLFAFPQTHSGSVVIHPLTSIHLLYPLPPLLFCEKVKHVDYDKQPLSINGDKNALKEPL